MKIDRSIDPYLIDPDALLRWLEGKLANITQSKLAKALAVDPATVSRWKQRKSTRLYQEQLQAIAQFESKPIDAIMDMLSAKTLPLPTNIKEVAEDYVIIPLYSVSAGAGNGAHPGLERVTSVLKFPRKWLRQVLPGMNLDELQAVEVVGDSMPPLRSGDSVIHDPSDIRIRDGIFVIRVDGDVWVKRLSPLPGQMVRISSDNPVYPPIEIPQTQLEVLGKVVYACVRYG